MVQPCGEARLPHGAFEQDLPLRAGEVSGHRELLDRDLTIEKLVMAAPNRRRAAAADARQKTVPPRQKPPFVP
ncbi:hypothetical protein GCM10022226_40330 [Sphaerisporangium flaviroseum]|uniref:Uncharacterized protein n=1 Tax=Sphaerisporangium flaviroseum TaxID=509199 RepID=A0ABP7ID66_9ACTN